jgi:hypothetical protein
LALIAGLGLGLYITYTQTVVDGWDPLAYLYAGERIAEGKGSTLCHAYNEEIGPYFTLAGFNVRVNEGPCLRLNYPPGFPMLLAAAQGMTGEPDAALYVPALLGSLGLVATFGLGAVLADRWVGLLAAGIVALTPAYLSGSTSPWSDVAGTVFLTGGITLFLWGQSFVSGRKGRATAAAVLGGGLVVYGLFVRYTNVVALVPLALYILMSQRREAFKRSDNWLFGGLVLLGLLGILAFNRAYFGGYLTTGYSPGHGWYSWPAFSLRYALGASPVGGESLPAALDTLVENVGWLVVPGLIGLVALPRDKGLLVGGSVLGFTVFYGLYAFAPQGVNARFLLPAFPALAVAVAYGLRYGALRWGRGDRRSWLWSLVGGGLMLVALGLPLVGRLGSLQERNAAAERHVETARSVVAGSAPDAVFLAYGLNDPIFVHGERTSLYYRRLPPWDPAAGVLRWDQFEPRLVEVVTELLERDVPVYYVQDSDPPFADSLAILQQHFSVRVVKTSPPVYEVEARSAGR